MRLLIQRVRRATVEVEGRVEGSGSSALVFLDVTHGDTPANSSYLASKLVNLRMFHDEKQKMNWSLLEIKGECDLFLISFLLKSMAQYYVLKSTFASDFMALL